MIQLENEVGLLAQMTPLIVEAQAKGTIGAAWLTTQWPKKDIAMWNYIVNVDLSRVETGSFVNSKWAPKRRVNGDDIVIEWDQAAAAGRNQSGSGLIFGSDGPSIQRVKFYRYR